MTRDGQMTLKLHVPEPQRVDARLQVSAGTQWASELGAGSEPYKDWARLPKLPWRKPSSEELDRLLAKDTDERRADIHLIQAPSHIIDRLRRPLGDISKRETKDDFRNALNTEEYRGCINDLGRWAATFGEVTKQAVVRINSPKLCTVTRVNGDGTYIGMHVDNWYGQRLDDRAGSPNRICLNIGTEPRHFLFIPLEMKRMFAMLQGARIECVHVEMVGTPLGLAFMEIFPDYPVFRLRVEPGEAYIAPTEDLVHDASTEGMKSWDMLVSILGRFVA